MMLDALDQYRQAHLNHAFLNAEDELDLLCRAQTGDGQALARIVEANQLLVMSYARRYFHAGMAGDLDLMDLVQAGNMGLLEAIKRFDQTYKCRFITYAGWWVRLHVRSHGLRHGSSIARSRREADHVFLIYQVRWRLQAALGRPPRLDEIAAHANLSRRIVKQTLDMMNSPLSLDADIKGSQDLANIITSTDDTEADAENAVASDELRAALAGLPTRTAQIMAWRYGIGQAEPLTYREIGRRLGISRTRVREIELDAMRQLRERLA